MERVRERERERRLCVCVLYSRLVLIEVHPPTLSSVSEVMRKGCGYRMANFELLEFAWSMVTSR